MRLFIFTVITQLINCLPDVFEDPEGRFLEETLAGIRARDEYLRPWLFPISTDEATDLIRALLDVLPQKLSFVFHCCENLLGHRDHCVFAGGFDERRCEVMENVLNP
ncbi:hypothetical protein GGR53DRAFT_524908 [Hypoxylon sp. FL1150]|nr:hypothetical protein GGR53DRAFT_524908 [Hypoxylon sp. FL1150]